MKKTLSPKTFASLDGSVLYDGHALIDYRAMLGPGLGFYGVKNDKRELSLEAGLSYQRLAKLHRATRRLPLRGRKQARSKDSWRVGLRPDRLGGSFASGSYVWEKLDGESNDYLALQFAERYTCQMTETAKLVQSLEYVPEAEDFDNALRRSIWLYRGAGLCRVRVFPIRAGRGRPVSRTNSRRAHRARLQPSRSRCSRGRRPRLPKAEGCLPLEPAPVGRFPSEGYGPEGLAAGERGENPDFPRYGKIPGEFSTPWRPLQNSWRSCCTRGFRSQDSVVRMWPCAGEETGEWRFILNSGF